MVHRLRSKIEYLRKYVERLQARPSPDDPGLRNGGNVLVDASEFAT